MQKLMPERQKKMSESPRMQLSVNISQQGAESGSSAFSPSRRNSLRESLSAIDVNPVRFFTEVEKQKQNLYSLVVKLGWMIVVVFSVIGSVLAALFAYFDVDFTIRGIISLLIVFFVISGVCIFSMVPLEEYNLDEYLSGKNIEDLLGKNIKDLSGENIKVLLEEYKLQTERVALVRTIVYLITGLVCICFGLFSLIIPPYIGCITIVTGIWILRDLKIGDLKNLSYISVCSSLCCFCCLADGATKEIKSENYESKDVESREGYIKIEKGKDDLENNATISTIYLCFSGKGITDNGVTKYDKSFKDNDTFYLKGTLKVESEDADVTKKRLYKRFTRQTSDENEKNDKKVLSVNYEYDRIWLDMNFGGLEYWIKKREEDDSIEHVDIFMAPTISLDLDDRGQVPELSKQLLKKAEKNFRKFPKGTKQDELLIEITTNQGEKPFRDLIFTVSPRHVDARPELMDKYEEYVEEHTLGLSLFSPKVSYFVSHAWNDDEKLKNKKFLEFYKKNLGGNSSDSMFGTYCKSSTKSINYFWIDQFCIDLRDNQKKEDCIACLPIMIVSCRKMLLLLGKSYFKRLWCVWELVSMYNH